MNTNLAQTIMTVLMLLSGLVSSILISFGCTTNAVTQAIDCSTAANAPVWLLPYLAGAATVLGVVKVILAAFEGKLVKPTVPVSKPPSQ